MQQLVLVARGQDAPSRRPSLVLMTSVAASAVALLAGLVTAAPARAAVDSSPATGGVSAPRDLVPPPPPKPKVGVSVTVTPSTTAVVGVAYPITAKFTTSVQYRGRAEKNMKVYVRGVLADGAWYWKDSRTAVFRLRKGFWAGHSTVSVRMTLAGVVLKESTTYLYVGRSATTRDHSFRTARALVAKVDSDTHRMKIYVDGVLTKNFGVSLGKEGFLTRSGIKAVMEKYLTREMTSEALGITDPNDQYVVIAPYATRLTTSGEFAHGAPWANGRIGKWNGSHGCTNLFEADAKWFYYNTRVGDPVVTVNTGRSMEYWNGLGAPWNMPWSLWLQKSALKGQTA